MSPAGPHRCGTVALLGRPNSGKSTLLNALVGEKLAIVTPKAQTTRGRMLAVLTRPGVQLLLFDTPGVHRGQARFNLALTDAALQVAGDADVRAVLLDCGAGWDTPEERLAELPPPLVLVRTKRDLGAASAVPRPERFARHIEVSGSSGAGLDALVAALAELAPEGPPLYPDDYLTDAPLRFLAAERIREVVFEQLRDELPYAVAVEVQDWKEDDAEVRVRADLLVERESQKAIVVGAGGARLKSIGVEARRRLRELTGKGAHLSLWVKTDRRWTQRPRRARELGYL